MTGDLRQETAIQQPKEGMHIFYCSRQLDKYIEKAVAFVEQGILAGDQVMFVENMRIYPMVRRQLEERLTAEQLEKVHYVDNFTFYWKNRSFHPETILAHFIEITGGFQVTDGYVRTWGHIEWGEDQDIVQEIAAYETALEELVSETNGISVCAYDASRLPDDLKKKLLALHNYYMTDSETASFLETRNMAN